MYIPTKEEWDALQKSITDLNKQVGDAISLLNEIKYQPNVEYWPANMTIPKAAKYMGVSENTVKSWIYKQKLIEARPIADDSTVYIKKKDLDEMPYAADARRNIRKQITRGILKNKN